MKILETTRIPLKEWQKTAIAVGSALGKYIDLSRGDLVATLGETTGEPAFKMICERMKKSTEGREILANRPRITASSVQHLYDLPTTTFGGAYAEFMRKRNFSADDRIPIRFCESDELAYVMMRARDAHDIWHTLFNIGTNLVGETALKVIEFEQLHSPMGFIYLIGGSIKFNEKQRKLFYSHYFPWAVRAGLQASDLMCVYYERYYEEDIDVFRRRLGIIPATPPPNKA